MPGRVADRHGPLKVPDEGANPGRADIVGKTSPARAFRLRIAQRRRLSARGDAQRYNAGATVFGRRNDD